MRATTQSQHSRLTRHLERHVKASRDAGLVAQSVDSVGDDGTVTIDGKTLANFGSCSYLGLWEHNDLKKAALSAIEQFGVSFSSSRLYAALPHYRQLEELLGEITGGAVIATGSTTLGHLSALPALVGGHDAIVVDRQAHASLHLATQVLTAREIPIVPVPHADLEELDAVVTELSTGHERVWYLADGVYSMFGDIAPIDGIYRLLDRHSALHAYLDDAHGFGWAGRSGRGVAIPDEAVHPRAVIAISLSKAFGAGGGAVVTGDPEFAARIAERGGPLMFGGPIQTAELAAGVAAAELLLSPAHRTLQQSVYEQIDRVIDGAKTRGITLASTARTPIWFSHVGPTEAAIEVSRRVREAGYWVNVSAFPVVPFGQAGVRFTTTLSQTHGQIDGLLDAIARSTADVAGTNVQIDLRATEAS